MIILGAIIGVLTTTLFCVICHWYLCEAILEAGYSSKAGRKAKKALKKQSTIDRVFLRTLSTNATKKKGAVAFYSLLVGLNVVAFVVGIVANCVGCLMNRGSVILYIGIGGGLAWLCLLMMIVFIPDLLFLPSERARYMSKDPVENIGMAILGSIFIIGGILMIIHKFLYN